MDVRAVPAALAVALVAVLAMPAVVGASSHVACGDVITEDTTLEADLVGCPGDGLTVGAPGVTLDLAGHSITGAPGAAGAGVIVRADQVTVEHGTVSGFAEGVRAREGFPGASFRLASMRIIENGVGVSALDVDDVPGAQVTIQSSRIDANAGPGIFAQNYAMTVSNSRVRRNGAEGIHAVEVLPGRYELNDVSGNAGDGLFMEDSFGALIHNRFDRNHGDGVRLEAVNFPDPLSLSFATGNEAGHNGGLGFFVSSLSPWEGFDGGGNIAAGNGDTRQCVVETVAWAPFPPIPPDALVCHSGA